ncbi:uncharacterized protein LOC129749384 [Uranotaenia lowii]|uniref:uncharacterized protein LOC129749384 n=1 Tax=Uranotaenia lowii TaxID=190385 RepID=UPI00247AD7E1|nr:uncharacterized protein LOC129749384 [Uranotaenia lowii]
MVAESLESHSSWDEDSPTDSETKEQELLPATDGFTVIFLIKELSLACVHDEEPRPVEIRVSVAGQSEMVTTGTIAEFNNQRKGHSIPVGCQTPEGFKRFLTQNTLEFNFFLDEKNLGHAIVELGALNLDAFEPPGFEAIIVSKTFDIYEGPSPVGCIKLNVKTDRLRSSLDLNASKFESDSILYIVNDEKTRKESDYADDTMRQLLTCKKCNVLKSPSEISVQYELIDGILVNRDMGKKDMDLETMKQKIDQIEREARLFPDCQDKPIEKDPGESRFCDCCGGFSITGATCKGMSAKVCNVGYPEGSAKRFSAPPGQIFPMPGFNPISEPAFDHRKSLTQRYSEVRTGSETYQGLQKDRNSYLCPKSIGYRFCDRCGLNMDWLPAHSRCPKCDYRPEPGVTAHEMSPSRVDSWMGSLKLHAPVAKRASCDAVRSTSMEMKSCPICKLRGGTCPDCNIRRGQVPHVSTLSSTSDSEMCHRKDSDRAQTRQSLRDRCVLPKKLDKKERISQLNRIYGEDQAAAKAGRKSSELSLNVDEIMKKSSAIPEVKKNIRKGLAKKSQEDRCPIPTAAEIRKNQKKLLMRVKKQNRGVYSYKYGGKYPGIVLGHKTCVLQGSCVPPHMGWMWNTETLGIGKKRRGWRPGAVKKPIKELMQHFLVSYPLDNIPVSKKGGRCLKMLSKECDPSKQKPTLQIVKRNGEYTIVMNPLKDSKSLKTAQDPYLSCEPIRFKLAKDPHTGKLYQLRKALQVKGFNMCGCTDLSICDHRSEKEKKLLEKAVRKLSKCLGLPKATGLKDLPSDSESEMDLEFTPPSAMLNCGVRKPDVVCTETQYCEEDYKVNFPCDKIKCKPGREDPKDVTRAINKLCKDGKGGKDGKCGKGGKIGKDGKCVKGGKAGGKTAGGKDGGLNKSKVHRPEGSGPVVILKERCKPTTCHYDPCMPAQNVCMYGAQPACAMPNSMCYTNACAPTYASACAPTYGMCYGPY